MTLKQVCECLPTLSALSRAKTKQQRSRILAKCKTCVYKAIAEIAKNTLASNIPLSPAQYSKLKAHKSSIRKLAQKGSLRSKQELINQSGGFLPSLLIPAVTFLAEIVAKKLIK